jgi:hypothetical protein
VHTSVVGVISSTPFKLLRATSSRPTVNRPVNLGVGPSFGAHDQICITVGHLQSSCSGAPCLTTGQICNLLIQFPALLRSKSRGTHDHLLLSQLRLLGSLFVASDSPPQGNLTLKTTFLSK